MNIKTLINLLQEYPGELPVWGFLPDQDRIVEPAFVYDCKEEIENKAHAVIITMNKSKVRPWRKLNESSN